MKRLFPMLTRNIIAAAVVASMSTFAFSQSAAEQKLIEQSSGGGWFWIFVIVGLLAVGVFLAWRKFQSSQSKPASSADRVTTYYNSHESYDMDGLDVDKELEWLRKTKKPSAKSAQAAKAAQAKAERVVVPAPPRPSGNIDLDTKAFQEKMRKLQYAELPINSFMNLTAAKLYEPLPESDDPSLLNAIEQADEEYEEDEAVRELALKILTAFRTRNAVDALSQIALYDLSSNLRSKAVSTLTDFDHPSVFESILLACADPTREVRAAAARGLFRLSFDRADAWKRIMETNDEFRISHAARAAIESGIAVKSFERLVHEDLKVAYEAFSLVAFLIASGENEEIFKAIRSHRDERVKFALLHVLKVRQDPRTAEGLEQLLTGNLSSDVQDRVKDAISSFEKVLA
ncbi:MAG: hypothetical protein QM785_11230 [Pyrinomonadaceae bacterium]